MKKLMAIIIILVMLSGLSAIETDKVAHFLGGISVTLITHQFLGLECGIVFGSTAVAGKEFYDKYDGDKISEGDICCGMAGIIAAGAIIAISEHKSDDSQTYRREMNLEDNVEWNYVKIKLCGGDDE